MYDNTCPPPLTFWESSRIVFSLAGLFLLGFISRIIFSPLMPAIEQDIGISHSQAGLFFLTLAFGFFLAPVCSGFLTSKINHLGSLKISALGVGAVLVLFGVIKSYMGILILMFFLGLFGGLHLPSAIATITAHVGKSDWGKALSVHQSAPPFSSIVAPIAAAILLGYFAWDTIIVGFGVIALIFGILFAIFGEGGEFPGKVPSVTVVKTLFAIPSFWIMLLLFAMAMAATAGAYSMLPLYFVNERGMEIGFANTILGLSQISGLLMVFVAGWVTDKIGEKKAMAITLLIAGILSILLGVLSGWTMIAVLFAQAAMAAAFFPAAFSALSRVAPSDMRSVSNSFGAPVAFVIGGGVVPVFIGYMGQAYTFGLGITCVGCFMALGPALIPFLKLQEIEETGC